MSKVYVRNFNQREFPDVQFDISTQNLRTTIKVTDVSSHNIPI